ncbi:MAG: galactose mutarotase [Gemmiger sp.]|nr:galactose mutarotase [Gemmiger sp.]
MSVTMQDFGKTTAGQPVKVAILKNAKLEVHILSLGGIIARLYAPSKTGAPVDVALGYPTPADYELNHDSMGAVVGRFANRIGGAAFPLDGQTCHITPNEGPNCLHSGLHNFGSTLFAMEPMADDVCGVSLTAQSPDGTDGFPGCVNLEVQYSLAGGALVIRYYATTDRPTVINITNHCYFNLNGHDAGSVLGHRLSVESPAYLETDDASIPTGTKLPAENTPMDFNTEKTIGRDIEADYLALRQGQGYDQCYLLPDTGLRHAAWLVGPETGIRMETLTTQPALQLYSGNHLAPTGPCKGNAHYAKRDAVCLETQHLPDSPNHPDFPDTTLRPGETFDETTVYKFDVAPL